MPQIFEILKIFDIFLEKIFLLFAAYERVLKFLTHLSHSRQLKVKVDPQKRNNITFAPSLRVQFWSFSDRNDIPPEDGHGSTLIFNVGIFMHDIKNFFSHDTSLVLKLSAALAYQHDRIRISLKPHHTTVSVLKSADNFEGSCVVN